MLMLAWLAERRFLPDFLIRLGMRIIDGNLSRKLTAETRDSQLELFDSLHGGQRVEASEVANEQHYELPPEFFSEFLGSHLKYSCCWWPEGVRDLDNAEQASLAQVVERAGIENGMDILELGCGWGSFSLYSAGRFPLGRVVAVSHSARQKEFILKRAVELGISNIEVITANIDTLTLEERFDRVVSIEMFEHVRNWRWLLRTIAGWLRPGGRLFAHFFVHSQMDYTFEAAEGDWMAKHFFTGGLMPSPAYLKASMPESLTMKDNWHVNGLHYAKTLNAWLSRYDNNKKRIMPLLRKVYGNDANVWWQRWRLFFMGCAEFFGFNAGAEWFVYHCLCEKQPHEV